MDFFTHHFLTPAVFLCEKTFFQTSSLRFSAKPRNSPDVADLKIFFADSSWYMSSIIVSSSRTLFTVARDQPSKTSISTRDPARMDGVLVDQLGTAACVCNSVITLAS